MRIACISASRVPSRAANSIEVMKVCQAFIDIGHQIRLWIPKLEILPAEKELANWYGLHRTIPMTQVSSIQSLRRYDFAWRAVSKAKRWDPDLVYCWPFQAAYFSNRRGMPTAVEFHDRPHGRIAPSLVKAILGSQHTVRVLPITHALCAWLERVYRHSCEPPRTVIAPMGVDLEPYQDLPQPEQVRHALGLRSGLTVGYTGHLYPGRGLELMTTLARLNPEVHFLWVGGEPGDVSRWKRRLETEGIGNITLTGFIPNENLHQYQAACEFLLMPYQHAIAGSSGGDTAKFASPMKVFEYLASGRVILSSDLPVLREILDESNSVMLPADEPAAWDKTLKALIQQPEQRIKLGNAAKKTALEHSWKARAERILAGLGNG